jgi:hypothetical protein
MREPRSSAERADATQRGKKDGAGVLNPAAPHQDTVSWSLLMGLLVPQALEGWPAVPVMSRPGLGSIHQWSDVRIMEPGMA